MCSFCFFPSRQLDPFSNSRNFLLPNSAENWARLTNWLNCTSERESERSNFWKQNNKLWCDEVWWFVCCCFFLVLFSCGGYHIAYHITSRYMCAVEIGVALCRQLWIEQDKLTERRRAYSQNISNISYVICIDCMRNGRFNISLI